MPTNSSNKSTPKSFSSNEIRELFLKFFEDRKHLRLPSSSLIPKDDKSIMFTNSGMVQFKDVFLGKKPAPHNTSMATTSQKCLRAGGKHNDLDNVGKTARHHTFFEMLGNFSFNNYFKKEAIEYAWEFLTETLAMDKSKLHISVYETDDEAYDLWHKHIGVPASNIVRKGDEDNFWYMGSTGPCGPCSEIHFDRGDTYVDHDERYLEIWNLVFMQYYQDETGEKTPLKHTAIDTGMGLERMASILQDTPTNYETDLFMPIIKEIEKHSGCKYGTDERTDIAIKVIADHARSISFLIADGEKPSNEGSGYVLRRILRRASQFAQTIHGDPFLHKICAYVVESMKGAYGELGDAAATIERTVVIEETQFRKTLKSGEKMAKGILDKKGTVVSGEDAFQLYDTYGFPVDILQDIAEQHSKSVDIEGFEKLMEQQKKLGKSDDLTKKKGDFIHVDSITGIPPTEFTGYTNTTTPTTSKVLQILHGSSVLDSITADNNVAKDDQFIVILDRTPFYGEGGGQVGDIGTLSLSSGSFAVEDTQKYGGIYLHKGRMLQGSLSKGDTVDASIDTHRRSLIERNHTAAHIFFQTAQEVFGGGELIQAGAHINEYRMKLDFQHHQQVSAETLALVEKRMNERIIAATAVAREVKPIDVAKKEGALGIFEDKYGDMVNVISIGNDPATDPASEGVYSKELCGGCHVRNTSELGMFFFTLEEAGGSGVRRVEGITGDEAYAFARNNNTEMKAINVTLNTPNPAETVKSMASQIRALEDKVQEMGKELLRSNIGSLLENAVEVNGVKIVNTQIEPQHSPKDVVYMMKEAKGMENSLILVWSIDNENSKGAIACGVSPKLMKTLKAGDVIKKLAELSGGRGGGKPDFAQAGSKDVAAVEATMANATQTVQALLA